MRSSLRFLSTTALAMLFAGPAGATCTGVFPANTVCGVGAGSTIPSPIATLPSSLLPAPTLSALGGVEAINAVSHNWIDSISTLGVPHLSQPTWADLSGTTLPNGGPATSGSMSTGVIFTQSPGSQAINIGVDATLGYTWLQSAFINDVAGPVPFLLQPNGGNIGIGTGTALPRNLVDIVANGIYSSTQQNEEFTVLLNGLSPSAQFSAQQGGLHATEAITGGIAVPSTATVHQESAIAGYVTTQSPTTNAVAGYFQGIATANGTGVWGINAIVSDTGITGANTIYAAELDVNAGSTSPTYLGLSIVGASSVQPAVYSAAIELGSFSSNLSIGWNYGIDFAGFGVNNPYKQAAIRLSSGSAIVSLNHAATGNIPLLSIDSSDNEFIGGTGVASIVISNSGYLYEQYNNDSDVYPLYNTYTLAISDNFSRGLSEVDFFNTSGASHGFNFYYQTGTSAVTLIATLVNSLVGSGSRPVCVTAAGALEPGSFSAGLTICP